LIFHPPVIIFPDDVAMKKDEALNIIETFLTDEQLSRLQRAPDMTGAPISTLIRIAVADYLKSLPKNFTPPRNLSRANPVD
jgi:hypothetical protein